MSSMRTKTHVADIVGDNVFCEKIADKKVNLSCRLLCSLHCCLQGKPLSFKWIFQSFTKSFVQKWFQKNGENFFYYYGQKHNS